jgi:hypothetical protein
VSQCRCGKPTRDEAYVCDDCTDDLGRALGDVTWLDRELEVTITRQKAATYDGSSAAGADIPTPVNWAASEARTHLHALLVLWVRLCSEEGVRSTDSRHGLPEDNLTSMSHWLLWRVDGLALHEAGSDAVDELTSAVAHCHRLIDRRPERRFLGPCNCGRDLYAATAVKSVVCEHCGQDYDTEALREMMFRQVTGRLVTAREGATLLSRFGLETKQGTIDKWRERKRLAERGHNARDHRLYLWEDLLALAQHADARTGA